MTQRINKEFLAQVRYMIAEGFIEPEAVKQNDGLPHPALSLSPAASECLMNSMTKFQDDFVNHVLDRNSGWFQSKGGAIFHVPLFTGRFLGAILPAQLMDVDTGEAKEGGMAYIIVVDIGGARIVEPGKGVAKMGFTLRSFEKEVNELNETLVPDIEMLIKYLSEEKKDENQEVRLAGHGEHGEEVRNPRKAGRRKKVVPPQCGGESPDVRHGGGEERGDAKTKRTTRKKKGDNIK